MNGLRLRSTVPKAYIVNFNISKTVTDIHLKQVAVQQQMKYFFRREKASVLKCLDAFKPATIIAYVNNNYWPHSTGFDRNLNENEIPSIYE